MYEKITLALQTAEDNYIHLKNLQATEKTVKLDDHIVALSALFDSFIHYGFAVSQITEVFKELNEEFRLYESLIEPHLRIVDDIEMVARQYSRMYVQYIAKIAQGFQSQEAVKNLFT